MLRNLEKVVTVYQNSEVIFEEGSLGEEMYIIRSGTVKLARNSNGHEIEVAILRPGEFFGEMALVDNAPRSLSAIACENDTQLLSLDRDKFLFMVSHQPAFALTVMHVLCQRIRTLNERLFHIEA